MRIHNLEKQILEHNKRYWVDNSPTISDSDYDRLIKELPNDHPLRLLVSKEKVNNKYKHPFPILSVNRVFDLKDLFNWMDNVSRDEEEVFILQPKYDGLQCAIYNRGTQLATIGNSYIGENISNKKNIINLKRYKKTKEPRYGELVFHKSELHKFYEVKKDIGKLHTNPRTTVVQLLSDYNDELVSICKTNGLRMRWVPFDHHQQLVTAASFKSGYDNYLNNIFKLGYPIDGFVLRLFDIDYFNSLGTNSHHWNGMMAYKFDTTVAKSRITEIIWEIEKDKLIPYAHIKPIELNGEIVHKINLHNRKYIEDNNIQNKDFVLVEHVKGHDSHILSSRISKSRKACMINKCPSCNGKLIHKGENLICNNLNCLDTQLKNIMFQLSFINNIYITEIHVKQLMILQDVTNLIDLLSITKDDLVGTHRFHKVEADNIMKDINNMIKTKLTETDLLTMLSIPINDNVDLKKLLSGYSILSYTGVGAKLLTSNKHLLVDLMKLFNLW